MKILLTTVLAAGLCLQAVPASFASEIIPEDVDVELSVSNMEYPASEMEDMVHPASDMALPSSDDSADQYSEGTNTGQDVLFTEDMDLTDLTAEDPDAVYNTQAVYDPNSLEGLFEEDEADLMDLPVPEGEETAADVSGEDSRDEMLWDLSADDEIAEITDDPVFEEDEMILETTPLAAEETLTINAWDRLKNAWGPIVLLEGYQYPAIPRDLQLSITSSKTTAESIEWQKKQSDGSWKKDTTGRFSAGTWRCVLGLNGATPIHDAGSGYGSIDFKGFPSGTKWHAEVQNYNGNYPYTSSQFTVNRGEWISKVNLKNSSFSIPAPETFNTVPSLSDITFSSDDTSSSKGVTFEAFWARYEEGHEWYQFERKNTGDTFLIGRYYLVIKLKRSNLEYSFLGASDSDLTNVYLNGVPLSYKHLQTDGSLLAIRSFDLNAEKDGFIYEMASNDKNSLAVKERKSGITDPDLVIPGQVTFGSRIFPVTEISSSAFDCDSSIETVQIPASVTLVDFMAFEGCENLREVTFGPDSNLKEIGMESFSNCKALKKIDLPNKLEKIGEDAFAYCEFTDLFFPASLQAIDYGAFRNCTSLACIVFSAGSSLEVIGESAFADCTSLTTQVVFPASLKNLYEDAFYNCKALSNVMFEKGSLLTFIGDSALGKTSNLHPLCISYFDDDASAKKAVEDYIANNMIAYGYAHVTSRALKDTAKCKIAAIPDQTYSGSAIIPAVTVTYGSAALKPGTDYAADWKNNTNAGTATLTITGKGDYYGSLTKGAFRIVPASIAAAAVADIADQAYTGKELKPSPAVTLSGKTLKADKDYTLSYKDNKAAGTATLTVTGKGNYTGTVSKSFRIFKESTAYPSDVVSPDNPAALDTVMEFITNKTDESDLGGSAFSLLQARGTAKSSTKIRLKWNKVPGAEKYIIYGNKCGKKNRYEKLAEVTKTSWTQKGLKKGTYYKYLIAAVSDTKALASSKTIHVATKGGKRGNNKSVTIKKGSKKITKLTLKTGKKTALKAAAKAESSSLKVKNHRKIAWETSDIRVATVSSKGKITAVAKGTCYVYAYAQNGVTAKIRVMVK